MFIVDNTLNPHITDLTLFFAKKCHFYPQNSEVITLNPCLHTETVVLHIFYSQFQRKTLDFKQNIVHGFRILINSQFKGLFP